METLETKYPHLAGFFDSDLKKFVLPDLKRLREEVRPDGGKPACTIPTAMMVFALLDLLGFLMRDKPAKKKQLLRELLNTKGNIDYALSPDAGLLPVEYAESATLLRLLFRNGLMHQVFPKRAEIAKASPEPWLIAISSRSRLPVLNVDRLTDDVIAAVGKLEERVRSPTDDVLASRMNATILFLHEVSATALKTCGWSDI